MAGGMDYICDLLPNVHEELSLPPDVLDAEFVRGDYLYYHYGCDGFDDRGWGCGYRTLMTLCSWVRGQLAPTQCSEKELAAVPSHREVQDILVQMGDKETDFRNSMQWIGSVEASIVLDQLYNIPCKIIHANSGDDLEAYSELLFEHFQSKGSPIMMGGDSDNSSKCVAGICRSKDDTTNLLIIDPHFWGEARERNALHKNSWVKWQNLSEFSSSSFYNLCLPQLAAIVQPQDKEKT